MAVSNIKKNLESPISHEHLAPTLAELFALSSPVQGQWTRISEEACQSSSRYEGHQHPKKATPPVEYLRQRPDRPVGGLMHTEYRPLTLFFYLQPGKVVILLTGRYAGKKAVIVKNNDDGTNGRPYGHAIVVGLAKEPRKVGVPARSRSVEASHSPVSLEQQSPTSCCCRSLRPTQRRSRRKSRA